MSGVAELPLHDGHVPRWLLEYMERLALAILRVLHELYDAREIIRSFSDPLWFQAFNNVIGMDWDSSGSTTVVTAILKKITWREDFDFIVLGGKGEHSKKTINEIPEAVRRFDLGEDSIERYTRISRIVAKIDSSLLQDGYTLYHHSLMISRDGFWGVVQQGMNVARKMARRYHINQDTLEQDLLTDPHAGLASNTIENPLNLVDIESVNTRRVIDDIIRERPSRIVALIREVNRQLKGVASLEQFARGVSGVVRAGRRSFTISYYKPVNITRELIDKINETQLINAQSLVEALEIRGFGAEHVRALTLVADLIFNATPSNRDPVTHPMDPFIYSYAHGGKDGVPYRVRRDLLERTIITLEEAVERARIGDREKMRALERLARYSKIFNIDLSR